MENSVKIRKVSTALQCGCYLFLGVAALVVLMMLYHVLFRPDLLRLYVSDQFIDMFTIATQVGFVRAIVVLSLLFFPAPLLMYALWRLSQLFGLFRNNQIFTEDTAQHLYVFAWAWILFHLLPLPMVLIADAILTVGTGFDATGVSVFINGDEIPSFVASISFLVIAWVLRESVRIANENAEFV
ncbi:MAG: hypothetical protein RL120_11565 [Gammaproteobacteria bacterium]